MKSKRRNPASRNHPAAGAFSKAELAEMTDADLDAIETHVRREEAKRFFSKDELRKGVTDADLDEAAALADEYDRTHKPGWWGVAFAAAIGLLLGRASK